MSNTDRSPSENRSLEVPSEIETTSEEQSESRSVKQNSRRLEGSSSNVFTVSIFIGFIAFIIAISLPGRLDGGVAFLVGFLISFLVLTVGLILLTRSRADRVKKAASGEGDTTLQCPVCESNLTLTLTKASHHPGSLPLTPHEKPLTPYKSKNP